MPKYTALVKRTTCYEVQVEADDEDTAGDQARDIVEFGGSAAEPYLEHFECIEVVKKEGT